MRNHDAWRIFWTNIKEFDDRGGNMHIAEFSSFDPQKISSLYWENFYWTGSLEDTSFSLKTLAVPALFPRTEVLSCPFLAPYLLQKRQRFHQANVLCPPWAHLHIRSPAYFRRRNYWRSRWIREITESFEKSNWHRKSAVFQWLKWVLMARVWGLFYIVFGTFRCTETNWSLFRRQYGEDNWAGWAWLEERGREEAGRNTWL